MCVGPEWAAVFSFDMRQVDHLILPHGSLLPTWMARNGCIAWDSTGQRQCAAGAAGRTSLPMKGLLQHNVGTQT
jgi:hypothetical protein